MCGAPGLQQDDPRDGPWLEQAGIKGAQFTAERRLWRPTRLIPRTKEGLLHLADESGCTW